MGARGAVMADTVGQAATAGNKAKAKGRVHHVWSALRTPFSW
jgi:hypothetical protein